MGKNEIQEKLINRIKDVCLDAPSVIYEDQSLQDDLYIDSLDFAMIVISLENDLSIKLDEFKIDWRNIKTIGQLRDLFYDQIHG